MGLLLVVIVAGLAVLYSVVRMAVRDGVLDARARDDAALAQRNLDTVMRQGRTGVPSLEEVDDRAE